MFPCRCFVYSSATAKQQSRQTRFVLVINFRVHGLDMTAFLKQRKEFICVNQEIANGLGTTFSFTERKIQTASFLPTCNISQSISGNTEFEKYYITL